MRATPFLTALFSLAAASAGAQTNLPPETPEPIRKDLETIRKYQNEVDRLSRREVDRLSRRDPPPTAPDEAGAEGLQFKSITVAPPRTSITPDAPIRAVGNLERDPFEVSPQLRESRNRRVAQGDGVTISRSLRLRALARGPSGGVAQIQAGREVLLVHDGDDLDVDGIRYTVHVEADGLVLRGAGAPQYKLLVR
jgi:hypothetical protein